MRAACRHEQLVGLREMTQDGVCVLGCMLVCVCVSCAACTPFLRFTADIACDFGHNLLLQVQISEAFHARAVATSACSLGIWQL